VPSLFLERLRTTLRAASGWGTAMCLRARIAYRPTYSGHRVVAIAIKLDGANVLQPVVLASVPCEHLESAMAVPRLSERVAVGEFERPHSMQFHQLAPSTG
jgi:hypothetical protein